MNKTELLKQLHKGMVVSCQALEHEPLYSPSGHVMPLMAKAAKLAGACAIRANSVRDIRQIKEMVDLPIIGIIKRDYEGYQAYITPTMKEVDELVAVGCDIIAVDCTKMTRPNGLTASQFIQAIKTKYPQQLLMADIADLDDAINASQAGVDFVGTTMNGYAIGSPKTEGPNFDLVVEIQKHVSTPVIAEGRIHTPEQARKMLDFGAYCVVVGGAITRPLEIASRFMEAIKA